MSAYPLTYFPTWGEFRRQLQRDYSVEVLSKSYGDEEFVFLERRIDTETLTNWVPIKLREDERLTADMMRPILQELSIPLEDFGFTLG